MKPRLPENLPFKVGEKLSYGIRSGTDDFGTVEFEAKEILKLNGSDVLLLVGRVTGNGGGDLLKPGDSARVWVDLQTLTPRKVDLRLSGILRENSLQAEFDQANGTVTYGGTNKVGTPIGTHSLLSFIYAVRSFNLRRSDDPKNPVNDTRVAVFVRNKALVWTLRPGKPEKIDI